MKSFIAVCFIALCAFIGQGAFNVEGGGLGRRSRTLRIGREEVVLKAIREQLLYSKFVEGILTDYGLTEEDFVGFLIGHKLKYPDDDTSGHALADYFDMTIMPLAGKMGFDFANPNHKKLFFQYLLKHRLFTYDDLYNFVQYTEGIEGIREEYEWRLERAARVSSRQSRREMKVAALERFAQFELIRVQLGLKDSDWLKFLQVIHHHFGVNVNDLDDLLEFIEVDLVGLPPDWQDALLYRNKSPKVFGSRRLWRVWNRTLLAKIWNGSRRVESDASLD